MTVSARPFSTLPLSPAILRSGQWTAAVGGAADEWASERAWGGESGGDTAHVGWNSNTSDLRFGWGRRGYARAACCSLLSERDKSKALRLAVVPVLRGVKPKRQKVSQSLGMREMERMICCVCQPMDTPR